jgi:hypothetical protein
MDCEDGQAAAPARRKAYVRYSAELAKRLCERLASGELLYRICAEPDMPTPEAVAKWAKQKEDFHKALLIARKAGRRPAGTRGPAFTYCAELGEAIFERLCEGESLTKIGADPTMPSLSTIFNWRRRIPEFEKAVQAGKRIQAERFCDMGWEIAEAATPQTAYLTNVRLSQLRWMAGVMAPKLFRIKQVDSEFAREELTVLMRRFEIEVDPETGARKVVAWCPNPETGQVEREDAPDYRYPPGIPMPGGRPAGQ